jgi:hypothetical protein
VGHGALMVVLWYSNAGNTGKKMLRKRCKIASIVADDDFLLETQHMGS